ncbi:MAG: hypothetical protein IJ061_04720, partial [Lachnospiraceae bacterium]|nr:hypothetical protein [Lachnospiraceae bacterium]
MKTKRKMMILCSAVMVLMILMGQAAFADRYVSSGNGGIVYYDDGSRIEYNARGSSLSIYDRSGQLVEEEYAEMTESEFKNAYYWPSSSSSSGSSSSSKYADAAIYEAYWGGNANTFIAHWEADYQSNASYTLTLYRDGYKVATKTSSGKKSYDFTSTIANANRTGNYYFEVKAKWSGGHTDETNSDDIYVDAYMLENIRSKNSGSSGSSAGAVSYAAGPGGSPATTAGPGANTGWQNLSGAWKYLRPNGSYAVSCWEYINGKWYYFDGAGNMCANQWIQTDAWYYLGPEGDMLANQWIQSRTNSHIWYY